MADFETEEIVFANSFRSRNITADFKVCFFLTYSLDDVIVRHDF